ncbi:MAG: (d)CMP kinase [Clostridia bacterium]|nr:(d)CMP kinase [Clostridia bacterium]
MIQIAIDGPSGAGKSTVAKLIAKKMGIVYVDTGALYRTVGYYVRQKGVDPKSHEGVSALLGEIDIQVKYENGEQCVYLNGENLGDKIRQNEISKYASDVSAIPAVRAFLLDTQKSIASQNSVVMDGRDIGTVILPNADVKIFLTATDEERAKRRYNELIAKGADVRLEDILKEMKERDANDKGRKIAPAIPAEDAIIFDNTGLTGEESCEKILEIVRDVQNNRKEGVLQSTN